MARRGRTRIVKISSNESNAIPVEPIDISKLDNFPSFDDITIKEITKKSHIQTLVDELKSKEEYRNLSSISLYRIAAAKLRRNTPSLKRTNPHRVKLNFNIK